MSKTSKYNGVNFDAQSLDETKRWRARVMINGIPVLNTWHKTEREAAVAADKVFIQYNKFDKVNILKKKSA